jgi:hypothetical protein
VAFTVWRSSLLSIVREKGENTVLYLFCTSSLRVSQKKSNAASQDPLSPHSLDSLLFLTARSPMM